MASQDQNPQQDIDQQDQQDPNVDIELQPIKLLQLFITLEKLNNELIKNDIDNQEIQFFLDNMFNLSYNTILVVVLNLLKKYEDKLKQLNHRGESL